MGASGLERVDVFLGAVSFRLRLQAFMGWFQIENIVVVVCSRGRGVVISC